MTDLKGLGALLVVIVLLAGVLWILRRGTGLGRAGGTMTVETALSLGERRSLVIVSVEGRRLLLGVAPASVALVTELQTGREFDRALDEPGSPVA